MNKHNIKVFVLHYKSQSSIINKCNCYVDLWAGKNNSNAISAISGDDTGENISAKNKHYSELTGIYWMKENSKQDIIGSCHYRRFFTTKTEPLAYQLKRALYFAVGINKKRYGLIYTSRANHFSKHILQEKEIQEIFNNYDAILPQARKLKYTVEEHYNRYHNGNDLSILSSIIGIHHPQYLDAFKHVMAQKRLYANNMFILRQADFNAFSEWWFDILKRFEKSIDLNNYCDYQERVLGFLAERLLNVWFHKQQLQIKELPVIYFKKFKDYSANVESDLTQKKPNFTLQKTAI